MGPIAERLIAGVTAAAEGNRGATAQAKGLPFLIDNFKIAFHLDWSVIEYRHFC
jgi:hypothetical protein